MSLFSHPPASPGPDATLADWLGYIERIHPATIDMGLERVRTVAERMGLNNPWPCPTVVVAGTNGKGSTCAMLAAIYQQAGYRAGVYSSPHLVHFNERCRIDGVPVDDANLIAAFAFVESARCQNHSKNQAEVSLSYFEFTTLAILWVLAQAGLDVAILEVGLGGRLDAVNIVDADCAVITSIDIDHTEFLGHTREAIGFEKAGILRTGRAAVVSDPSPPQSVRDRATEIEADLWVSGVDFGFEGDKQQWGWKAAAPRGGRRYSGLAYPALRGANQLLNASGVLAVLEALRERLPVTAQAVRNGLAMVDWPGRFQIVPGEPALVLDVAHNPHSVAALALNLDAMGFYPATHAVFGAMADKDLPAMLAKVAPIIDRWYLTDLPTPRAETAARLAERLEGAGVAPDKLAGCFASPQQALEAAVAAADPTDRIVVFGSFFTVGGVLLDGTPRLAAKHLQR
ncbi:bifunctional folylpolyglutamate synthase/dihydrofolate synthase [Hydrogenophaga soli]